MDAARGLAGLAASLFRRLLAYPLTTSFDLDDPSTTELRRKIIASELFFKYIYNEWYSLLATVVPSGNKAVVELGSGAGIALRSLPGLIASDVFPGAGIKIALDATRLPFADSSLRAILMTNILHHVADVRSFFRDDLRYLCPSGKILTIEPWIMPWSRFVYTCLHHEPFQPEGVA